MTNNDMKRFVLVDIVKVLDRLRQKIEVLDALDRDTSTSGAYDLHDQLTSMSNYLSSVSNTVVHAINIVPTK